MQFKAQRDGNPPKSPIIRAQIASGPGLVDYAAPLRIRPSGFTFITFTGQRLQCLHVNVIHPVCLNLFYLLKAVSESSSRISVMSWKQCFFKSYASFSLAKSL